MRKRLARSDLDSFSVKYYGIGCGKRAVNPELSALYCKVWLIFKSTARTKLDVLFSLKLGLLLHNEQIR